MIISDLQYIESVEASEVTGGRGRRRPRRNRRIDSIAFASGDASVGAFGDVAVATGAAGVVADADFRSAEVFANGSALAVNF